MRASAVGRASARSAAAWTAIPHLSSAAPRPYSRPSRTSGSNGGDRPGVRVRPRAARRGARTAGPSARPSGPSDLAEDRRMAAVELEESRVVDPGRAQDVARSPRRSPARAPGRSPGSPPTGSARAARESSIVRACRRRSACGGRPFHGRASRSRRPGRSVSAAQRSSPSGSAIRQSYGLDERRHELRVVRPRDTRPGSGCSPGSSSP